MTYNQAVKDFERIYIQLYLKRVDYWTGQLAWSDYVDGLNRDGKITDKQRSNWATPFSYGKHLKPSYKQLCMAYDIISD